MVAKIALASSFFKNALNLKTFRFSPFFAVAFAFFVPRVEETATYALGLTDFLPPYWPSQERNLATSKHRVLTLVLMIITVDLRLNLA